MSLKTVFILNTIIAGFFALVCLFIPATMLFWYGVEFNDATLLMTSFFGVGLLAIALITFFLRNSEFSSDIKFVVLALLLSNIVGVIVAIWGQVSNIVNTLGWLTVIIYGFFTIAYLSIYLKK